MINLKIKAREISIFLIALKNCSSEMFQNRVEAR